MSWFGNDSQQADYYGQVQADPSNDFKQHDPSFVHELIAGAASYEAVKAYENHVAENGNPDSHAKAKEILAAFAGAFVDREVETRGLDFIDRERAKYQAEQQVCSQYDYQYNNNY